MFNMNVIKITLFKNAACLVADSHVYNYSKNLLYTNMSELCDLRFTSF